MINSFCVCCCFDLSPFLRLYSAQPRVVQLQLNTCVHWAGAVACEGGSMCACVHVSCRATRVGKVAPLYVWQQIAREDGLVLFSRVHVLLLAPGLWQQAVLDRCTPVLMHF